MSENRLARPTLVILVSIALVLAGVITIAFIAVRQPPLDEGAQMPGASPSAVAAAVLASTPTPTPLRPGPTAPPQSQATEALAAQPTGQNSVAVSPTAAGPASPLDRSGTLWAPYLEWSLQNPAYEGNPFDLLASVTFTHIASGETRRTEMFYDGGDTWKFRFSATRTGVWTFATSSTVPHLDGLSGRVDIAPNPDPAIKGFLVNHGNRFARQVGEDGGLEGVLFNVWQGGDIPNGVNAWYDNPNLAQNLDAIITEYLEKHGMFALYSGAIANRWFDLESQTWDGHASENPDLRTFQAIEQAVVYLHARGYHLHIWMWGDETRRQTPVGVGGINGVPDRRLQRYLAARLGPLPGWSLGYGFDLGDQDWIAGDTQKLDDWASYLNERMGWPHLLFTRGFAPSQVSGISYSSNGPGSPTGALQTSPNGPASYDEIIRHLDSDRNRPHLYEERFIYLREFEGGPPWTMDRTRQVLWWSSMAGGMGGFWGFWDGPLYPNPEQMRTHARFWQGRFLLDLERANHLTDGVALKTPSNQDYVFYKESTTSVRMDLSGLRAARPAVAIDTRREYAEISLGTLEPVEQTWNAPYESDWVIAIGFDE